MKTLTQSLGEKLVDYLLLYPDKWEGKNSSHFAAYILATDLIESAEEFLNEMEYESGEEPRTPEERIESIGEMVYNMVMDNGDITQTDNQILEHTKRILEERTT